MGLYKWLVRRGSCGQTARTIGGQYQILRGRSLEATVHQLLEQITILRHAALPYTPEQRGRLRSVASARGVTLVDFVLEVVLAEADVWYDETGDKGPILRAVIEDELRKLGLGGVEPDGPGVAQSPDRESLRVHNTMIALLTHINTQIALAELPAVLLRGLIGAAALRFDLEVARTLRDAASHFPSPAMSSEETKALTGRSNEDWWLAFHEHEDSVRDVLELRAEVWSLPDEIWDYALAITGTSRQEWQALPQELGSLLRSQLHCPSCSKPHLPQDMVHAERAGKTFLGKENPSTLHFKCPDCRTHFTWDLATGDVAARRG